MKLCVALGSIEVADESRCSLIFSGNGVVLGEAKKGLETNEDREKKRCDVLKNVLTTLTADEFVMASAKTAWSARTRRVLKDRLGSTLPIRWLNNVQ